MNPRILFLAGLLLGVVVQAQAQTNSNEQILQSLRRDMDELIRGQIQLQQQVTELKAIALSTQPRPQNRFPTNFTFSLQGVALQGDTNATVMMVEFSDCECPYCAAYTTETFPWIDHDYVKTGKVRYGLQSFPLAMHPHAPAAAAAVDCAGQQGKFWAMRDGIIANQNNLSTEAFFKTAARLGLQTNLFGACLTSPEVTNGVNARVAAGTRVGVTGTPTFFIGHSVPGRPEIKVEKVIVGQQPFDVFKAALDEALASLPPS